MIPQFPNFKKIELEDKREIEKITTKYAPHSDYNFTSIWSWNVDDSIKVSFLGKNLVLQMPDYTNGEQFLSFLGTDKLPSTITKLLNYANTHELESPLKLVSQEVVKKLSTRSRIYTFSEDRDSFDYILSVEQLMNFTGSQYQKKRNMLKTFIKRYEKGITVQTHELRKYNFEKDLIELFNTWELVKNKKRSNTWRELEALKRLLKDIHAFNVSICTISYEGKLVAFSIDELIHQKHAIIHFEKSDTSFAGITEYLKQQVATHLHHKGAHFINYEQDLGLEGMRQSKLSYRPVDFHKKYTLSKLPSSSEIVVLSPRPAQMGFFA